jgi:hypothetical protein
MSDFKDIKTENLYQRCPNCGSIMPVDDLLACRYTARCCISWMCNCGEMIMIDCYYHILNKILIDVINFYITNKKENKLEIIRDIDTKEKIGELVKEDDETILIRRRMNK